MWGGPIFTKRLALQGSSRVCVLFPYKRCTNLDMRLQIASYYRYVWIHKNKKAVFRIFDFAFLEPGSPSFSDFKTRRTFVLHIIHFYIWVYRSIKSKYSPTFDIFLVLYKGGLKHIEILKNLTTVRSAKYRQQKGKNRQILLDFIDWNDNPNRILVDRKSKSNMMAKKAHIKNWIN